MPTYTYVCSECGLREDYSRLIAERDREEHCPREGFCTGRMKRDAVGSMRPHTDTGYQKPILSDALAVHASQIDEAKRRFPHHEFAPDGRMVLRSHRERQRVLKDLGMHDRDGFSG